MEKKVEVKSKIKIVRYEQVELGAEELQTIERTLEILSQTCDACFHPDLRMAFAHMCSELAKFKEKYIDNGFEVSRETVHKQGGETIGNIQ